MKINYMSAKILYTLLFTILFFNTMYTQLMKNLEVLYDRVMLKKVYLHMQVIIGFIGTTNILLISINNENRL
jgi:hypothetical protein